MKTWLLLPLMLLTALSVSGAKNPMKAVSGGKPISDELIGIFFEDISHAADGGLNAELIQNGSFEYNPAERDGWGAATSWKTIRHGHSLGYIQPVMSVDEGCTPTYMKIYAERIGHFYDYSGWTGIGLQNDGFDGISVHKGNKYNFSVRAKNYENNEKQVRVILMEPGWRGKSPIVLAEDTIYISHSDEWKEYATVLCANGDCKKATLQFITLTTGELCVDDLSLIPEDTYNGHGLRRDMVEAIANLSPKFMRFPGGCVVHGGGDGMWNTYRWKNTVGPKWARKQMKNTWGYHQSMALGFFEYFQLCEDVGMQPMPILPCGVSCQGAGGGWGMRGNAQDAVPTEDMDEWVDDVLDLIEWANGDPAESKWAKMRADAGHPAPFNLKYIGLGNEEKISEQFVERFRYIYDIVTQKYPEIIIVGTAGPGSHPGNGDYERGWKFADEIGLPIIDEHYYEQREYFMNSRQYDTYPRERKTKVYLGEYAAKDKKLIDALAEALYLLHIERNGDVVCMTSYAPLFARRNATNWNPDLIYFDNEQVYLTCSYYVQQMFGRGNGQYLYEDCVTVDNPSNLQGHSVVLNTKNRTLYVKLCNASDSLKQVHLNLSKFPIKKEVSTTILTGNPNDENDYDHQPIKPYTGKGKARKVFTRDLPPYTFMMLEYKL